jgi:hypothetical protein
MNFNTYVNSYIDSYQAPTINKKISIYPISELNIEGIEILIDNCMRMGSGQLNNVQVASIDPSLWLGSFIDKHFNKLKFVTLSPTFTVTKLEGSSIISKSYTCNTISFNTEKDIDEFLNKNKWKTFVIFSIVKIADLSTMKTSYNLKYCDITEKNEERDNKINDVLKTDKDN